MNWKEVLYSIFSVLNIVTIIWLKWYLLLSEELGSKNDNWIYLLVMELKIIQHFTQKSWKRIYGLLSKLYQSSQGKVFPRGIFLNELYEKKEMSIYNAYVYLWLMFLSDKVAIIEYLQIMKILTYGQKYRLTFFCPKQVCKLIEKVETMLLHSISTEYVLNSFWLKCEEGCEHFGVNKTYSKRIFVSDNARDKFVRQCGRITFEKGKIWI